MKHARVLCVFGTGAFYWKCAFFRAEREAAYADRKEDMAKWVAPVQANRQAETLDFTQSVSIYVLIKERGFNLFVFRGRCLTRRIYIHTQLFNSRAALFCLSRQTL